MSMIRPLLPLLILGGLGLFAWQNWSPSLPLVFLGRRTQELPLAFWLVLAIVAGALTMVVLSALQGGWGSGDQDFVAEASRAGDRPPSPSAGPRSGLGSDDRERPERSEKQPFWASGRSDRDRPGSASTNAAPASRAGDWESGSSDWLEDSGEDWDAETARSSGAATGRVYERDQRPDREVHNGSEYSYSYERGSGVGRTEAIYNEPQPAEEEEEDAFDFDEDFSEEPEPRRPRNTVYDADYRVITPPLSEPGPPVTGWSRDPVWQAPEPMQRSTQSNESNEEDDWGLTEDDEDWSDRP